MLIFDVIGHSPIKKTLILVLANPKIIMDNDNHTLQNSHSSISVLQTEFLQASPHQSTY
jgi:hypothetical protein